MGAIGSAIVGARTCSVKRAGAGHCRAGGYCLRFDIFPAGSRAWCPSVGRGARIPGLSEYELEITKVAEGDKKAKKKEMTPQQRRKLSPEKRERQNEKRNARNRARKEDLKIKTKAFQTAVASGDVTAAEKALTGVVKKLDRVKFKSTVHKNTAARRRSRLTKRLNALKSGALKPVVAKKSGKTAK
jgi:small subunit ribosomal protein S20